MSISVVVPNLGESVVEGTVARWLVAEGESVTMDQIIVELTTDKVDVEIPSPSAGVIEKIVAGVDDTVEVGAELAVIDENGTAQATSQPIVSSPPPAPPEAAPALAPIPAPGPTAPAPTPLAQRAADQAGVDTSQLQGSGGHGRVTQRDVVAQQPAAQQPAPQQPAPQQPAPQQPAPAVALAAPVAQAAPPIPARASAKRAQAPAMGAAIEEGDRVIPMSRLRKLVADHMVYSKRTSPHVGTVTEIDMTAVVELRKANKAKFEANHRISLTFLPFIIHSVVRALRENPALNASVIEDTIVEKRAINIGIAVETEKGLVVPVIREADRLSLAGMAAAIDDLSTRARTKKLTADDLRGGTFTVSNPGRKGNLYGFAIINQPQVGILRMGEMVKRPVVRTLAGEDAIVIRSMMHLALSYDHRAVDGSPANSFLFRIRELLENAEFDL
ncbi:MAG: 2-oxoglutarate dehydrogenase E2 component (dihydrolipoamide succinyltransferase) [Myxococcota bacterium]|jgi:2-oxoglutarate dehydrogenase E2 component (dihydrolipoamide succinyltransferase)